MMNIRHSSHNNERQIMQNPSNDWVQARIMDMVDICLGKLIVTSLPAHEIPNYQEPKDAKAKCTSPVNEWVAKEIVFNSIVIPRAHPEPNIKYWPLPKFRGEIILFIWVRNQRIVGRHHGNIQMNKVFQERRLVGSWITRWDCILIVNIFSLQMHGA